MHIELFCDVESHLQRIRATGGIPPAGGARKIMTGEGIFPGDRLIIRSQKTAERDEIVIARVDNEVTVKYLHSVKKDIVTLKAANPELPDIIKPASECSIEGKVIGITHAYADNEQKNTILDLLEGIDLSNAISFNTDEFKV